MSIEGTGPEAPEAAAPAAATSMRRLIRVEIAVRWRELDALNHVNNANFLGYVEEARLHWFESLQGPWMDESLAPLLAAVHVNYRRPIGWPARIGVELFAERVGRSSLTIAHRISDATDDAVLYSDGNSVLVWADRRTGRSGPLPEIVRAAAGG